jgi:hypothetical protein
VRRDHWGVSEPIVDRKVVTEMRHLLGFLLALAMSAALFFGGGLGAWRFSTWHGAASGVGFHALIKEPNYAPLAALLGAAALLGILLVVQRVSPLATGLPGLALLGWSAYFVLRGHKALSYVPLQGSHYAAGFTVLLESGFAAFLGVVMLAPFMLPSRWHGPEIELDLGNEDVDMPTAVGLVR